MVSAGSYLLSALAWCAGPLAGLQRPAPACPLDPDLGGPARPGCWRSILAIALLVWLAELLGSLSLLYGWALVALSLLVAGALAWRLHPLAGQRPRRSRTRSAACLGAGHHLRRHRPGLCPLGSDRQGRA